MTRSNPSGLTPVSPDGVDPRRMKFAEEVIQILAHQKVSDRELFERADIGSHTRLYKWLEGRAEPSPCEVFAIEDALGLKPGRLSLLLGYDRPGLRGRAPVLSLKDHLAAIEAEEALPDWAKAVIRTAIRAAKEEGRSRRR